MVKLDLLLNLICTSNLFTNAIILSDFMMIVFFLEWHSYSPWGVRDQLILSTSLFMYNPTLLLQCTQWMVNHIIDTYNKKILMEFIIFIANKISFQIVKILPNKTHMYTTLLQLYFIWLQVQVYSGMLPLKSILFDSVHLNKLSLFWQE